jgi:hypothetical protein
MDRNVVWWPVGGLTGLPQDWGSGGTRHWRELIVGWSEPLSEAVGTERAIVTDAALAGIDRLLELIIC